MELIQLTWIPKSPSNCSAYLASILAISSIGPFKFLSYLVCLMGMIIGMVYDADSRGRILQLIFLAAIWIPSHL
ncbi:hypothetical protein C5167_013680 [Papaver somniferum]|uniref:Uncharacterized protein n=1 Tax=Papaver somniferum TaxID=3469 RepID=A0A4Y7J118_PAPSO|nr:hypothetical protein C5167_013680 [Papaver somniferum]